MKKICFAGAYGIRSQGDDAALVGLMDHVRHRWPSCEGVVITRHADEDPYGKYGMRSVPNIEFETRDESIGRWFRGFNPDDDRAHLYALLEEIGTSEVLVLGAGNFLVDYTIDLLRGPIPYLTVLSLMARTMGTPVFLYGISVGPFRTRLGTDMSYLATTLADQVSVRDSRSLAELRTIGYTGEVLKLPDPVLLLDKQPEYLARAIPEYKEAHSNNRSVVAVSVRFLPEADDRTDRRFRDTLSRFLDAVVSKYDVEILFVPQCTYPHGGERANDIKAAMDIARRMRHGTRTHIITADNMTVQQCQSLYSNAIASICMRLHANTYSAIQGVPSLAINYNPKVMEFMKWLGMTNFVLSPYDIHIEKAVAAFDKLLDRRSELQTLIKRKVERGRQDCQSYIDCMSQLSEAPRRKMRPSQVERCSLSR